MRMGLFHGLSLILLGLLIAVVVRAADPSNDSGSPQVSAGDSRSSPEEVFKSMGLSRAGSVLITADEADVHTAAIKVRGLKAKLAEEAQARLDVSRALDVATRAWTQLDQQMKSVQDQEKADKDSADTAGFVVQYNELLRQKREKGTQIAQLQNREGNIEDSLPAYSDAVAAAASQANAVSARYAAMAGDETLKAAIAKYNSTATQPLQLGPSAAFSTDLKFLTKCSLDLADDAVCAKIDHGVPVVQVSINGKTEEMIWDSGATMVSLSAQTAENFGLHATDADRTVQVTMADGKTANCKLIVVPEIRVGAFVATNVECLISPPSNVRPPDLLGSAFQRHFFCRVDQQAQMLHLTPIDKSVEVDPKYVPQASATAIMAGGAKPTLQKLPTSLTPTEKTPVVVGNPQDVFNASGLKPLGFMLVMASEADVRNATKAVRDWKSRTVFDALDRADVKRTTDTATQEYDALVSQLAEIDAQLKDARSNPNQYNQLVGAHNQMIVQIKSQWTKVQDLQQKAMKLDSSRSGYVLAVVTAVRAANAISDQYAAMAADPTMQAAVLKYNSTNPRRLKLGPSAGFASDLTFLRKCATDLATEGIPAYHMKGESYVQVGIKDKVQYMIWDSGAATVSLSAETAQGFGIKPSDQDPTVQMEVANGSIVKCKLVIVPEIRVGPFIAKNVACTILPPGDEHAASLLGGAFQKHFLCRLDQQAGVLHLTPNDSSAESAADARSDPADIKLVAEPPRPHHD